MKHLALIFFVVALLGMTPAAKADYPAEVCPIVQEEQPTAVCHEPESTVWRFDNSDTHPNEIVYIQSDGLSEAESKLLSYVRQQFNCPDCRYLSVNDFDQVNQYNRALLNETTNVSRVMYSNHSDHSEAQILFSFPDLSEPGRSVIGRIETVTAGQSWYNNNPNAKIFFLPNTTSLKAYPNSSTLVTRLSFFARCSAAEVVQSYSSGYAGQNLHYCQPVSDPGPVDGASSLDALKEGCAYGCNPVNLATGAKLDYAEDYRNHSPFPIVWERWYYSSAGGWTFGHERRLKHFKAGNGNEQAVLWRPDGTKIRFQKYAGIPNWTNLKMQVLGKLSSNPSSTARRFTYVNLNDETEHYDANGRLTALLSVTGQSLTYTYNSLGELTRIDDDFGRHLDVHYMGAGKLRHVSSVTDGNRTVSYQTETQGPNSSNLWAGKVLLKKVTYPDNKSVEYLYDENLLEPRGLMTGIIREDGQRYATYLYDPNNRVMQTQHGQGLDTTQYSITPGQDTFVGWQGGETSYPLTSARANGLSKTSGSTAACPNCGGTQAQSISYADNGTGAISSMTSFEGIVTTREVNSQGLPTMEVVGEGGDKPNTTIYSWHPATRLPATVYEQVWTNGQFDNRMTTYAYDAQNRLESKTVAPFNGEPARVWSWTYNPKGQPLSATAPGIGTTVYTYDTANGNLLTVTNSLGQTVTFSDYTPQGKPGKITDANGLESVLIYDPRDRVTQVKKGSAATHWETMTIAYTDYGNIKQVTRPDGTWIKYAYDSAHRLTEVQDQRGKLVLTLDNNGDVTKQEVFDLNNALTQTSSTTYDTYRRVAADLDANNKASSYLYLDSSDRLIWETDPDEPDPNAPGKQLVYLGYDGLGQPTTTTTGNADTYGRTTTTNYAKTGQLVSASDGNFVQTTFVYNAFGEVTQENSPDAGTKAWTRNDAGQATQFTDGRGATKTMTYDAAGRITQVVFDGQFLTPAAANETQTFAYDTCSFGVGRLCQATDHAGTTAYTYDLWGRVTQKTFTPAAGAGGVLTTAYDYNAAGQLASLTYPSGKRLDYTYDRGLVTAMDYDFQPVLTNAQYRSGTSAIQGWTWGSTGSGQVTLSYDLNGRLSRIQDVDDRQYGRNHKGWITSIVDANDPTANQTYTYSQAGYLKQAVLAARPYPIDYALDDNNNIYDKMVGPEWEDDLFSDYFTNYSINNRPFDIYEGLEDPYQQAFDGSGNMTDDGQGLTLVYDAKGRVRSSARLGYTTTYAYNSSGQRMRKSDSTLSTGHRFYAYDEAGRVLGEYDAAGNALEEYVYLDGHRPVAVARNLGLTQSPDIYPILTDHFGTPRKILNPSGTLVWSWDAKDPYGYQAPNELESGTVFRFDLRFPGQRYDQETGLYHNGFRDYSPKFGRYVQADPIGLAGGWNHYTYAGSDPINNYDFTGLKLNTFGNKDVEASLSYLKTNSKKAYEILTAVENSEVEVNISAYEGASNKFHIGTNKITWDPRKAMYCIKKNAIVSPALLLFHEIYHSYQEINSDVGYPGISDMTYTPNSSMEQRYTKPAEYDAIVIESIVAWQLGEGGRSSHNGNYRANPFTPVSVESSTPENSRMRIAKTKYRYEKKSGPSNEW